MSKGIKIFFICLLSILAIVLTCFLIFAINGGFSFRIGFGFNSSVSGNLIIDNTYENVFNNIEINSDSSNIYLYDSLDDKIRVVIYGDKDKNQVVELGNKLSIKSSNKKCYFVCFNYVINKVEVYIPESYNQNIRIINKYGDIDVNNFVDAALDVSTNFGDIVIGKVKDVKIDSDFGDIKIDTVANYFNIDNDFGDIILSNVTLNKNSSIKSDFGDIRIGNTNEFYIDAKNSFGDININNNYNKSDITLKIKSSFGDIKVNN